MVGRHGPFVGGEAHMARKKHRPASDEGLRPCSDHHPATRPVNNPDKGTGTYPVADDPCADSHP